MYDPVKRSYEIEKVVSMGNERRYYRFRPARWYGGIATGDVVGCNLLCVFCWAGDEIRFKPEKVGKYYSPQQAFKKLSATANKCRYTLLRLSGQEPTIGRTHLLALLDLIDKTSYRFILETNGILIGEERDYAKALAKYKNVHVRISLKGTDGEEFSTLTMASPKGFELQLQALRNLIREGVSCHPSVMTFSKEKIPALVKRLKNIEQGLGRNLEIEQFISYPHVTKRLTEVSKEKQL